MTPYKDWGGGGHFLGLPAPNHPYKNTPSPKKKKK